MSPKEKAIAACDNCFLASLLGKEFKVGWLAGNLYETGIGSKISDEGLFFWADTGYGYDDRPCWAWESRPYFKGLLHAFHEELASVLCEDFPFPDYYRFSTLASEYQAIKMILGKIAINGEAILSMSRQLIMFDVYRMVYVPVVNPSNVTCFLDALRSRGGGITVRLYSEMSRHTVGEYPFCSKVLTGNTFEDVFDLLVCLFDLIDVPYLPYIPNSGCDMPRAYGR